MAILRCKQLGTAAFYFHGKLQVLKYDLIARYESAELKFAPININAIDENLEEYGESDPEIVFDDDGDF